MGEIKMAKIVFQLDEPEYPEQGTIYLYPFPKRQYETAVTFGKGTNLKNLVHRFNIDATADTSRHNGKKYTLILKEFEELKRNLIEE